MQRILGQKSAKDSGPGQKQLSLAGFVILSYISVLIIAADEGNLYWISKACVVVSFLTNFHKKFLCAHAFDSSLLYILSEWLHQSTWFNCEIRMLQGNR